MSNQNQKNERPKGKKKVNYDVFETNAEARRKRLDSRIPTVFKTLSELHTNCGISYLVITYNPWVLQKNRKNVNPLQIAKSDSDFMTKVLSRDFNGKPVFWYLQSSINDEIRKANIDTEQAHLPKPKTNQVVNTVTNTTNPTTATSQAQTPIQSPVTVQKKPTQESQITRTQVNTSAPGKECESEHDCTDKEEEFQSQVSSSTTPRLGISAYSQSRLDNYQLRIIDPIREEEITSFCDTDETVIKKLVNHSKKQKKQQQKKQRAKRRKVIDDSSSQGTPKTPRGKKSNKKASEEESQLVDAQDVESDDCDEYYIGGKLCTREEYKAYKQMASRPEDFVSRLSQMMQESEEEEEEEEEFDMEAFNEQLKTIRKAGSQSISLSNPEHEENEDQTQHQEEYQEDVTDEVEEEEEQQQEEQQEEQDDDENAQDQDVF